MEDKSGEIELFKANLEEITISCRNGMLTLDQLNDWKGLQLRQVLTQAKHCSPFYAQRLGAVAAVGLHDMSRLPFTTRDDPGVRMGDMLSVPGRDAALYDETSADTGAPTPCPPGLNAGNLPLRFAYEDVLAANFPPQHKPVLGVLGPAGGHAFSRTLQAIAKDMDIGCVTLWPDPAVAGFDRCLSLLQERKIDIVAMSPGQAMALAKEARKRGLDPAQDFAVRVFMLSGGLCTPALAANLKSIWGAEVYNSLYGSRQAPVMATATADNCLRPHLSNYIFEIIHPQTGQVLEGDQRGELVVTRLLAGAKPLIRYRTGDLVRMIDTGAPDLYRRYRLEVAGRVNDGVTLNGIAHTAAQIESAIMSGVSQCYGYQVIITRQDDEDAVIAKLALPDRTATDMRVLLERIGTRISARLACRSTVMAVEDWPEHVDPGGSLAWQAAHLIDTRAVPDDENTAATGNIIQRLGKE